MKVRKWVDFGQEIEVDIDAGDIRAALAEAFSVVTTDRLGEEGPNRNDILIALNRMAAFLHALTDEQISLLMPAQRATVARSLREAASRFAIDQPANPPRASIALSDDDMAQRPTSSQAGPNTSTRRTHP